MLILKLLILLVLANGTPVVMKKLLGGRFAWPLDGGIRFFDGRPLFGSSKTVRGTAGAVLVTSAGALALGLDWRVGALVGVFSMLGDLFSSFCKRRAKLPPSSRAVGLDQVPESLFPMLAVQEMLALSVSDILIVVGIFFVSEVVFSPLFYRLKIRDRPY